ncbi:MAG: DNA repair protein RecO [Methylobacter sp.]|nr:DNA repair protein RecO [Methylobacter sp.]MDP2098490.1 DNA repair protein RecO [Methylobacter sp.]MDP2427395.1 DNA repair protein RecO [Methylobacter sp.]MDP3056238.1 DNA repair protein RecO [Methylobacter sp.]MDP3361466.1 DNA repair protein RecO [Methylobacter sp.]
MTETAVYLQPAFILQQQKYRETSLIIDALSRDFGRISLLAKGVRKTKSKTAGLLQPFIPLSLSFIGQAELKTLTAVERRAACLPDDMPPFSGLQGMALYCGFYINELVTCFLHKYDPHPEVFEAYQACLFSLAEGRSIEAALRLFELQLMEASGYALQLEYDNHDQPIEPLKKYRFEAGQGPVAAENGAFSGKTLQALNAKELTDAQVLGEAKILMRKVIDVHLQGKPLKSRAVIQKVIAATPTVTHHQIRPFP